MAEEKMPPKVAPRKSIFDKAHADHPVEAAPEPASSRETSAFDEMPAPTMFRLPRFFSQGVDETSNGLLPGVSADLEPVGETEPVLGFDDEPSSTKPAPAIAPADSDVLVDEIKELRAEMERLSDQVASVNDRETALERVFDALHGELSGYKNDFLYEHLKPVVRPLLFLFDSIEQFEGEVTMAEATGAATGVLSAPVVHENVRHFRDQLVEVLQVCEVTIMETPSGPFNAKLHKAIDVMPVAREQDNTIVRVVRAGWFLNGQLLRPAEVVVGKYRGPA